MDTWAHPSLPRIMCARQGYRAGFGGPTDCGGPFLFLNSTFRPSSCPSALNAPHSHSGSSCPFSFKGWSSTQTDSHAELAWKKGPTYSPSKNTKLQEGIRDGKNTTILFTAFLCYTEDDVSQPFTFRNFKVDTAWTAFPTVPHFFYGFSSNVVCMRAKHCLSGCC